LAATRHKTALFFSANVSCAVRAAQQLLAASLSREQRTRARRPPTLLDFEIDFAQQEKVLIV
jgi:hypothetical protein